MFIASRGAACDGMVSPDMRVRHAMPVFDRNDDMIFTLLIMLEI